MPWAAYSACLFDPMRWLRDLLTGRWGTSEMRSESREFLTGRPVHSGPVARPSQPLTNANKKPLVFFLAFLGTHTR
jgi:hypothetical protein